MINYYVGKPRSGKTYAMIKHIYDHFINVKTHTARDPIILYTNVNGFQFDKVNGMLLDHPVESGDHQDGFFYKRAVPLNWEFLYSHLIKIKEFGEQRDDELVEYLKKNRLYNCYFAIDECHKYLYKDDPVLVWWLGYHGHMGHTISFVTQNLGKVHQKYKFDSEMFLEAQPKSKGLSHKQLRYKEYASDGFSKDQLTKSYSVLMKDEIHSLYSSGDIHKPKLIILPLIGFLAASIVFMIFGFKFLFSSLSHEDEIKKEISAPAAPQSISKNLSNSPGQTLLKTISETDLVLYLNCNSEFCSNADYKFMSETLPYSFVHNMLKQYGRFLSVVSKDVITLDGVPIEQHTVIAYQVDQRTAQLLLPNFFIPAPVDMPQNENDQRVTSSTSEGFAPSGGVAEAEG